ncbi:MAG: valine--tRNA ligase [Pirellulales bacterium]|nr:valine--tRNA ligase [Pirellulales bacterium]
MSKLPKQYDHTAAQDRWYAFWEGQGYFHSRPSENPSESPYSMVIPPPNVTGALHLGHALNNTIQDVLVRYQRMQGRNAMWMPGTDHAGIATQAVVERRIREEEGKTRHDLGRQELVRRIWKWKDEYEARILGQLKKMGASCDWDRTSFTFDESRAKAVRHYFFSLFKAGLIYRGKRLVNWDTQLQTAVADDEIFHETTRGSFWTFKYPVVDEAGKPTGEFLKFSTTRPETMLGDVAVAVHPDDERYQHLIGKMLAPPIFSRQIPIIADAELVDPELGTGAVKVTPAHDPNDYQCGLRNNLPMLNILNIDGTINSEGGKYAGQDRFQVRKQITDRMEELGLLEAVEDREIELAHSDRSKSPVEPYLSDQWFVRMSDGDGQAGLAQLAMDAVQDGRVAIHPSRYAKTYLDWLGEKRDWCISRQLWWGHQIPIWHAPQATEEQLQAAFGDRDDVTWSPNESSGGFLICSQDDDLPADALAGQAIEQDPDVLDTWFSSALWPMSTLGWPENTPELDYYYPTDTLVTSRDIITLWVARMVIAGLHNLDQIPFKDVFIHPKILDGYGETMSKSKGNGVDPLDVIDRFGADSLRFGIAQLCTETQDVRLPVEFVCPHCQAHVPQTKKNRLLARVKCSGCDKEFSTQWAEKDEDKAMLRAGVTSERFEQGRNFCNKFWNASRFVLMNLEGYTPGDVSADELALEDRWMLSRLATVSRQVTAALNAYRFSEAANTLYHFAWDEFCSFYVEMAKVRLNEDTTRPTAQRILSHGLDVLLKLLHPLVPFLTEEVWQALAELASQRGVPTPVTGKESVMIAPWPGTQEHQQQLDAFHDAAIEDQFAHFQEVLRNVREIRNRQNIAPKKQVEFLVRCEAGVAELLTPMAAYFESMAASTLRSAGPDAEAPQTAATASAPGMEIFVDLAGLIDVDAEKAKNLKQKENLTKLIAGKQGKLSNQNFVSRAPAEVVQKERDALADLQKQLAAIEEFLAAQAK